MQIVQILLAALQIANLTKSVNGFHITRMPSYVFYGKLATTNYLLWMDLYHGKEIVLLSVRRL